MYAFAIKKLLPLQGLRYLLATGLLLTILLNFSFAQSADTTRKQVEIINSDAFVFRTVNGVEYRFLTGNVKLKHETTYMECDSALIYKETNSVDAFGHVYINDKDSVKIYCDTAQYNGVTKLSHLYGHVILTNGRMRLLSPEVFYDMNTRIGTYYRGGTVINDKTKITSSSGSYYNQTSDTYFRDKVVVDDPQFLLTTDTLQYNTDFDLATFYSYTKIRSDESTIYCYTGHYNTKTEIADFGYDTHIDNDKQQLYADSLYYQRNKGLGKAFRHFTFIDQEKEAIMTGIRADYSENRKYLIAWQRPMLINIIDGDSMFLRADTVVSYTKDTLTDTRYFFGYRNVRVFKKDLQGSCDSLFYSFEDSTFRMFYTPILWSDDMQINGDTMFMLTRNKGLDQIRVLSHGFITMHSGDKYYDQIKGNYITGYIRDKQMDHLQVKGTAQSLYYGKNEEEKFVGMNKALCAEIWMYFKDKKVDQVRFFKKPEAVFTPMDELKDDMMKLEGFQWLDAKRPKSQYDL